MTIPFNRPYLTSKESAYIEQALKNKYLSGDGEFTRKCHTWLEQHMGIRKALLTHSCTAALEMAAILADIRPGDEVIMPSYTFVSTANAFVLRGAIPVFVDIRPDTLNIDETLIEPAITSKTRAIVPVHYAGVACEMDTIMDIARRHSLLVIEDAAQGIMATYKGRALGSIGHMGTLSFHESKNIMCGEGGALLINDPAYTERAEIIREKGTNRSQFFRGQIDKYTWVDAGSSYLPSELNAACLLAQLEQADEITRRRLAIWQQYHTSSIRHENLVTPVIPDICRHNAHLFYLLLPDTESRSQFIDNMKQRGIQTPFHYVPLHTSPMGQQVGRSDGGLVRTSDIAGRLVRLPLWVGLEPHILEICSAVDDALIEFGH